MLVEEGRARLDAQDLSGATPLLVAVQCDASSVAFYLASKGAGLEVRGGEHREREDGLEVGGREDRGREDGLEVGC